MKFFVSAGLLITLVVGQQVFASTYITCGNGEYSIEVNVDDRETMPPKSSYKVYKKQTLVKQGNFSKPYEAFEGSFLNAYVWQFEDEDQNFISIATKSFKTPEAGIWDGKSDADIETSAGFFYGSTMSCEIEID